jgi:hypothetical protein
MPDYNNSKIYILKSPHTHIAYIGSSVGELYKRLGVHKTNFKTNRRTASSILFDYGDVYITLIRKVKCKDRDELRCEEQKEIDISKYSLCNKYRAYNSDEWKKEYIKNNNAKIYNSDYQRKYREDNKFKHDDHYQYWYRIRNKNFLMPLFHDCI